ncbi:hypothetical protein C8Q80DRAFT_1116855 [Daedaleopsis nitida]|nr:hypothetical protein C8Q80DRAFT_1116855 [Daedaleopsis nitida]
MFLEGASITNALCNSLVPINRLPPELLTYIFALIREESPVPAQTPVRWPFRRYQAHALEPALIVCRRWRDIALAAPVLWNSVAWGRSGYQLWSRSFGAALSVHIVSQFSAAMHEWCTNMESQIRELHIDTLDNGIRDFDRLLSFLHHFSGEQLEHCKIDIPAALLPTWSRLIHFPLFFNAGDKLRSLYLGSLTFLPGNIFPALRRFALCNVPQAAPHYRSWDVTDLLIFLAGSPLLEELYICRVALQTRAWPTTTGLRNVELSNLRYFALDVSDVELHVVATIRKMTTAIRMPSSCHRHFAPLALSGVDDIDALLTAVPGTKALTRLRLNFSQERDILQIAPSGPGQGSISLFLTSVCSEEDWNVLYALCTLSRVFAEIEELWVSLDHYNWSNIRTLPPLLSWFPKISGLAVAYPRAPRVAAACPQLKTFCINLPAQVMNVRAIAQMLKSRAETCPIRRVVIGHDPGLEWDVLAEVFALDEHVEEFVIEELDMRGLSRQRAFVPPAELHDDWPRWTYKRE